MCIIHNIVSSSKALTCTPLFVPSVICAGCMLGLQELVKRANNSPTCLPFPLGQAPCLTFLSPWRPTFPFRSKTYIFHFSETLTGPSAKAKNEVMTLYLSHLAVGRGSRAGKNVAVPGKPQ